MNRFVILEPMGGGHRWRHVKLLAASVDDPVEIWTTETAWDGAGPEREQLSAAGRVEVITAEIDDFAAGVVPRIGSDPSIVWVMPDGERLAELFGWGMLRFRRERLSMDWLRAAGAWRTAARAAARCVSLSWLLRRSHHGLLVSGLSRPTLAGRVLPRIARRTSLLQDPPTQLPSREPTHTFGVVGGVTARRRTPQAIRAVAALRERGHDVTLLLAGRPDEEVLELLDELGDPPWLHTTLGYLDDETFADAFASVHCHLALAEFEGTSGTLVSAVANGIEVVMSKEVASAVSGYDGRWARALSTDELVDDLEDYLAQPTAFRAPTAFVLDLPGLGHLLAVHHA